jgi:NADPH:quinone reductase-like Zn-dependent oxidoreductase
MKAIRIHEFGSPDVLAMEDVPRPRPGPDEVLIRVAAASVNPVDYKIRAGEFKPPGLNLPLTPGCDVSGVVEEIGARVTSLHVGDEVYALLDRVHGGYAEFALTGAANVVLKPQSIDHLHAAAVPLAAITAWQGLFDHGGLKAGERVLIHGAAGGVGHFAVQFAKDRGAYVIVTAREEDRAQLVKWGADEVIDYKRDRFEEKVRDIDLVLDLVGGETQRLSWEVLKEGGRLVSTLASPSKEEAARRHARGEVFLAEPNGEELARVRQLIDDGRVSVNVQQTFPLSETRRAQEYLEHEHVQGKVVLAVDTPP